MAMGLSSIIGTLAGMDPQTLTQAAEEEERKRLAAQTAGAVGQAQQAGQAYQQAAAAPAPDLGLAELFIPALIGNIASVIGQNPAYAEQGQQRIQQSRAQLLKTRADNLQALRDIWMQKAEAAQKAGDIEAEQTARSKHEQITRTYEMVQQNAEHASRRELQEGAQAGALKLEQERQRGDIATVQETGRQQRLTQAAEGSKMDRAARTELIRQGIDPDSPPGQERLLTTWASREIGRRNQLAKRGDAKSRNQAVVEIQDIAYRRWSSDTTPLAMGERLLRLRDPFYGPQPKDARYLLTGDKVFRKVRGKWEKDPEAERKAKMEANGLVEPYFTGP